jgi:heptosyltransferase-1
VLLPHGNAAELATSQAIAEALNGTSPDIRRGAAAVPLDALAEALAQCAGVIGVDSGVSHIAVALDLPHVQIYNFDTAWRTGPDALRHGGRQLGVFAQPAPGVDAVWQAWLACSAGAAA